MSNITRSTGAFILLLLAAIVAVLVGADGCRDASGCLTFSTQRPLAIGVLYAAPGSGCDPDKMLVDALEGHAGTLWQTRRFPVVIVKEEAGFSLPSAQNALSRLLARPNLAAVLLLDCHSGSNGSLRKMVEDAGVSVWLPAVPLARKELLAEFDRRIDAIDRRSSEFPGRHRIGRSALVVETQIDP